MGGGFTAALQISPSGRLRPWLSQDSQQQPRCSVSPGALPGGSGLCCCPVPRERCRELGDGWGCRNPCMPRAALDICTQPWAAETGLVCTYCIGSLEHLWALSTLKQSLDLCKQPVQLQQEQRQTEKASALASPCFVIPCAISTAQ